MAEPRDTETMAEGRKPTRRRTKAEKPAEPTGPQIIEAFQLRGIQYSPGDNLPEGLNAKELRRLHDLGKIK